MNVGRDSLPRRTKSSAHTSKQSRVCLTLLWNSTQLAQETNAQGKKQCALHPHTLSILLSRVVSYWNATTVTITQLATQ